MTANNLKEILFIFRQRGRQTTTYFSSFDDDDDLIRQNELNIRKCFIEVDPVVTRF